MRHCLHTKYWAKNGSDSSSDSKVTQVFMNICVCLCGYWISFYVFTCMYLQREMDEWIDGH